MDSMAWTFWEGPKPEWVGECVKTIRKHIPQTIFLDMELWTELRERHDDHPDLDLSRLHYPHLCDYIRVLLLQKFGGMWLDCDTIVAQPPTFLFEKMRENDLVCPRDMRGNLHPGLMLSKPNGYIISKLREFQLDILSRGDALTWGGLTVDPMTEIEADFGGPVYIPPSHLVMPITWSDAHVYEQLGEDTQHERTWKAFVRDNANPITFVMADNILNKSTLMMNERSFFRYVLRRIA